MNPIKRFLALPTRTRVIALTMALLVLVILVETIMIMSLKSDVESYVQTIKFMDAKLLQAQSDCPKAPRIPSPQLPKS